VKTTKSGQTMTPMSSGSPPSPKLEPSSGVPFLDSTFGTLDTSTTLDRSLDEFIATLPMTPSFSLPVTSEQALLSQPAISQDCTHHNYARGDCALNQPDIPLPSCEDPITGSNEACHDSLESGLAALTCSFTAAHLSHGLDEPICFDESRKSDSLRIALQLMGELSCRDTSPLSANLASATYDHQARRLSQLQAVINKNKKVIETVSNMLQSTSSQDGYFLVVICMIVSKVLSTYADAAQGLRAHDEDGGRLTPVSPPNRPGWSATTTEQPAPSPSTADQKDPVAAQRVLDELYLVQASVDRLGEKLQLCAKQWQSFGNDTFPIDIEASLTAFPFSATLLDQLYTELRKHLSTLSLELIDGLKQYWTKKKVSISLP
jgi:hypothetical protein